MTAFVNHSGYLCLPLPLFCLPLPLILLFADLHACSKLPDLMAKMAEVMTPGQVKAWVRRCRLPSVCVSHSLGRLVLTHGQKCNAKLDIVSAYLTDFIDIVSCCPQCGPPCSRSLTTDC